VHPDQHDRAERWHFSQGHVGADYLFAVCSERVIGEAPRLVFKQIVPLQSENDLDFQPLRISK
jgi:hypothetical protein